MVEWSTLVHESNNDIMVANRAYFFLLTFALFLLFGVLSFVDFIENAFSNLVDNLQEILTLRM